MAKLYGPYDARVDLVHDGDTVYLTIDLGFDHQIDSHGIDGTPRLACRVFGINAPELKKKQSDPDGPGEAALAYAQTLLSVGSIVRLVSHGWDKFGGRYDGTIYLTDGTDFAQRMLDSGNAVEMKP